MTLTVAITYNIKIIMIMLMKYYFYGVQWGIRITSLFREKYYNHAITIVVYTIIQAVSDYTNDDF